MANYSLILNPYTAKSFDDMIKPYEKLTEAYDKIEQLYETIEAATDILDNMIDKNNDPGSRAMYDNFMKELDRVSGSFLTGIMSEGLRRDLKKLKRNYNKDITLLQAAITAKQNQQKLAYEFLKADDSIQFERDILTPGQMESSLDNWVRDLTYGPGKPISLRKETETSTRSLGKFYKAAHDFYSYAQLNRYAYIEGKIPSQDALAATFFNEYDTINNIYDFGTRRSKLIDLYKSILPYWEHTDPDVVKWIQNGANINAYGGPINVYAAGGAMFDPETLNKNGGANNNTTTANPVTNTSSTSSTPSTPSTSTPKTDNYADKRRQENANEKAENANWKNISHDMTIDNHLRALDDYYERQREKAEEDAEKLAKQQEQLEKDFNELLAQQDMGVHIAWTDFYSPLFSTKKGRREMLEYMDMLGLKEKGFFEVKRDNHPKLYQDEILELFNLQYPNYKPGDVIGKNTSIGVFYHSPYSATVVPLSTPTGNIRWFNDYDLFMTKEEFIALFTSPWIVTDKNGKLIEKSPNSVRYDRSYFGEEDPSKFEGKSFKDSIDSKSMEAIKDTYDKMYNYLNKHVPKVSLKVDKDGNPVTGENNGTWSEKDILMFFKDQQEETINGQFVLPLMDIKLKNLSDFNTAVDRLLAASSSDSKGKSRFRPITGINGDFTFDFGEMVDSEKLLKEIKGNEKDGIPPQTPLLYLVGLGDHAGSIVMLVGNTKYLCDFGESSDIRAVKGSMQLIVEGTKILDEAYEETYLKFKEALPNRKEREYRDAARKFVNNYTELGIRTNSSINTWINNTITSTLQYLIGGYSLDSEDPTKSEFLSEDAIEAQVRNAEEAWENNGGEILLELFQEIGSSEEESKSPETSEGN